MISMHSQKSSTVFCAALAVALVLAAASGAVAQEKIIHNFNANGKDGYGPAVGLVFDADGNLFGTTENGGANAFGILYELSPAKVGGWFERVLFAFNRGPGIYPDSGLVVDGSGNLYGTTLEGGANTDGTVFELKHLATGRWRLKVLSDLAGIGDRPEAPLVFDAAGNLYGTTHAGGRSAEGTVFELSPAPEGTWTSTVLHTFSGHGTD